MANATRPDAFSPGAPLAPEAPTSIVETQRIGGTHWQQRKLVEDERRLDAVAKRAANKQMAHAEANPQMFKRGTLDWDGNFVAYADDDPRQTENRQAPAPHYIDPILHQIESRPANAEHEAPHFPERMTPTEKAKRDAQLGAPARVEVYIPQWRMCETEDPMGWAATCLAKLGADLSKGTVTTSQDEGGSVKVVWQC